MNKYKYYLVDFIRIIDNIIDCLTLSELASKMYPEGTFYLLFYIDFQSYFIWHDLYFLEIATKKLYIFKLRYNICIDFFQPFRVLKYVPFELKIMYVLFLTN